MTPERVPRAVRHAAWGGGASDPTSGQRVGSAVSVVIYAAAVAVVLARVDLSNWPRTHLLLTWVPWFAFSALANFASQSHWENYLLGPALSFLLSSVS
jgi:hypothetical protein